MAYLMPEAGSDSTVSTGGSIANSINFAQGNQRATLQLMVTCNDEELRQHLNTASKTATYISPMTQNQLIDASVIKRDIVTLPVTTATGERSFSALKYLKNCLRSKMGEERLNGLAHRPMCINRYQSELRKSH